MTTSFVKKKKLIYVNHVFLMENLRVWNYVEKSGLILTRILTLLDDFMFSINIDYPLCSERADWSPGQPASLLGHVEGTWRAPAGCLALLSGKIFDIFFKSVAG